jgi:hypothetical protein
MKKHDLGSGIDYYEEWIEGRVSGECAMTKLHHLCKKEILFAYVIRKANTEGSSSVVPNSRLYSLYFAP